MNNFTVYKHTAPSGKVYIGITGKNPARRWRPDGSGYKENRHFWNAIERYGWDKIQHEIVASGLSKEDACRMEVELIALYDSTNPKKGYNASIGGEHPPFTKETRKKLSKIMKEKNWVGENNPNYGNHKLKGANNPNYGKSLSDETKQLISLHRRGKGTQPRSELTRKRISQNHAGGATPKKVICIETSEIFESINEASRAKNINKKLISNCCRQVPHYKTAGGYTWKFVKGVI